MTTTLGPAPIPAPENPHAQDRAGKGLRERIQDALWRLGGMSVMTGKVLRRAVSPPYPVLELMRQVEVLGIRSLPIALLTSTFAGLVISLQFAFFLARFGVANTVGRVVALTLFRELAPVLTALTVGARIGSGIAAELGAMAVTEQVDAIRALGADPLRKLVVPRVLACLVVLPGLTVLADVIGVVGGMVVVKAEFGIPYGTFIQGCLDVLTMTDFLSGVFKGAVFGAIVGLVGCYQGLNVEGGTEGVGRATTQTVAIASVAVCLADFFITKLTLFL